MRRGVSRKLLVFGFTLLGMGIPGASYETGQPLPSQALYQPQELADLLTHSNRPRPTLIYAGFHPLFIGAHIKGAIFAGPDSKPEGLEQLRSVVRNIPHGHPIVIYCGCCPFEKCPNVRPAYTVLREAGFQNVKVVHIPTNLHTDWVEKGYPTTKGAGY
jgi:thiosulfate/3-mercaptopyruvate sulfurtransferase